MNYSIKILDKLERIENMLKEQSTKLMTLDEACSFLNISKSNMYKMTSTNQINFYQPRGKKIYFLEKDLIEWILKGKRKSKATVDEEAIKYVENNKRVTIK